MKVGLQLALVGAPARKLQKRWRARLAGVTKGLLEGMRARQGSSLTRRSFVGVSAAAVAAAGLGLAGCSADEAGEDPEESESESAVLSAACATEFEVGYPLGLCGGSPAAWSAACHVFEGLYDLDLHTYEPYCALATEEPLALSELEYEVSLREDACFSDGEPVSAQDVVASFEAALVDEASAELLSFIDEVSAVDDTTVLITLAHPLTDLFTTRLSLVKVVPAAALKGSASVKDEEVASLPVGSGPWMYEVADASEGGTVRFVPNPYYNGSLPAGAEAMEWQVLSVGEKRAAALEEATVQVVENVAYDQAESLAEAGATIEYLQGIDAAFLMFNTRKAPFDDPRVRQAFFYAIDVDALIAEQMANHAAPVSGLLPRGHQFYHEAAANFDHDPERAALLLAAAGMEDLSCTLIADATWARTLALPIQEQLAEAGIRAVIAKRTLDWGDFAQPEDDEVLEFDLVLTSGDPSCFGCDPDFLLTWWYGDTVWTQGRTCWKGSEAWTELQELAAQAREETDELARQELWGECFDLVSLNVPLYPLLHREMVSAYYAGAIDGYEPLATSGLALLGATPVA